MIIKDLIEQILLDAVKEQATSIQFTPTIDDIIVRYRIYGVPMVKKRLNKNSAKDILDYLCTLADLSIHEKDSLVSGRFYIDTRDCKINAKLYIIPIKINYNESSYSINIKICNKKTINSISDLGFSDRNVSLIKEMIDKPKGLILVTGPMSSGKTTTLYAMLKELNTLDRYIMTVENPIEESIPNIMQCEVQKLRTQKGGQYSYKELLKTILRQDMDTILIDEIKDNETANIVLNLVTQGRLVLSSIHSNNAISSIMKFINLGVKPNTIIENVNGIISQRLVRKICPYCKKEYDDKHFYGKGCDKCNGTGYHGFIPIVEVLPIQDNENVINAIECNLTTENLRIAAKTAGFDEFKDDGYDKVWKGLTTAEEIHRVL